MMTSLPVDPSRKIKERNLKLIFSGQLQPMFLQDFLSPIWKFEHLYFLKIYRIPSFCLFSIYIKETPSIIS